MKIVSLILTISALAAGEISLVKVEAVCPQTTDCELVTPNTSIKVTLAAPAAVDTVYTLFVDGKPIADAKATLGNGKSQLSFTLDKKLAATLPGLFSVAGEHTVSIGPPAGPALPSAHKLNFRRRLFPEW